MSPFRVLFREFFGQFFASESVTSDIRLRQSIIAVAAFLITPGLMLSGQLFPAYEFARLRAPELILPMTRMLATLFLTYSIVSTGLIGALAWDSLSFDRRDAMVLGPLPVSPQSVVRAKLAAMAALLVGASLSINVLTGIPFALVANGPRDGIDGLVRHAIAHLAATSFAALFMFSAIVILRALVGMGRGHVAAALGSLVQFTFVSGLLSFFIAAPFAVNVTPLGRGRATLHLSALPAWLPSRYFLALYEQLRGTADAEMASLGPRVAIATLVMAATAVLLTRAGYRRQFQSALSAPSAAGAIGGARINRALARAIAGSNRISQASSDFVLMTLARNRPQQALIGLNTALGLGLVVVRLLPQRRQLGFQPPSAATLLAVPLMLGYWASIGMRASFYVPSELPAAWTFRANAPTATAAYALGTRAAMIALIGPAVGAVALAAGAFAGGWAVAVRHAVVSSVAMVILCDVLVLTIAELPYTRPYEPGHAKLKTRWPLYLLCAYLVSDGVVRLEQVASTDLSQLAVLFLVAAAVIAGLEWAIRLKGRTWAVHTESDVEPDYFTVTTLDLSTPARVDHATQPS
jgi:hypothetical protein